MKFSSVLSSSLVVSSIVVGFAHVGSASAVAPASSSTYNYEWTRPEANADQWNGLDNGANNGGFINVDNKIGYHESIKTTYNEKSNILTWDSVFSQKDNNLPMGGWLVVTDGPNPKDLEHEYAIFYLDGANKKVTAYAYNGQNNSGSYKKNPFLGSWDNAVQVVDNGNERSLSFAIDVSSINNRTDLGSDWKGAKFGNELGLWFHASTNPAAQYNADGSLKSFTSSGGWFDSEKASLMATETKDVPEPITGTIAAVSALAMGSRLKKRTRKQK
ncbi:MAG: hypothetical protein WBB29_05415 [Geitlerinemataceae cyanobacterium]